MVFVIKCTGNDVTISFERDRVGNIVIKVNDQNGPIASTVESGKDFQKMSSILCD